MDYSLPGSSVRGGLQARLLEWVGIPFSRGSSQPGDRTGAFHTALRLYLLSHQGSVGDIFYTDARAVSYIAS